MTDYDKLAQDYAEHRRPHPEVLKFILNDVFPVSIVLEVGCGILILVGYHARAAALLLAGFCLATAVLFHAKLGNRNELLHFEKDLAIAGGLLVLFAHGAGNFALDALRLPSRAAKGTAAAQASALRRS